MQYSRVLMDFSDVRKNEKSAEFVLDSHTYMCCVSVNPKNNDILFSLFLDRKPVVLNRVVVVGEAILEKYGSFEFTDIISGDFVFLPTSKNFNLGNIGDYRELGTSLFLYYISGGE